MAFTTPRPAKLKHHTAHTRSTEAPMEDVEYSISPRLAFRNSNFEPPRKRTHLEANSEMDWSPAEPSTFASTFTAAFSGFAPRHSTIPSQPSSSPFMFDSSSLSSMQIDERDAGPTASTSSLAPTTSSGDASATSARDIASGAVQRERRKRDKLREWQVVKNSYGASVDEDEEDADGESEDETTRTGAGDEATQDSPGISGQIQKLLRRNRSSRRGSQPVHLSLHHHNYHYPGGTGPISGQDPFLFGPVSIPSTSSSSAASSLASSQQSAPVSIANPSHWWREEGPYILLGYLQFVFNSCLVIIGLYFLLSLLLALSRDIAERSAEHSIELQQEIMHCSEMYIQNRCEPGTRVPAMEKLCKDWEFCMNRNPKVVGRTRVAAETVAEVVNGFTEVISWRTMLFLLAILAITVSFTNSTISSYRRNHSSYHAQHQLASGQPYVPHHQNPHHFDPLPALGHDGKQARQRLQ